MKRTTSIFAILVILAMLSVFAGPVLASAQFAIPTISIVSVDPGKTVTIQTSNFPANDTFDVYMNSYGTLGIGGTKVTSINSGSGGSMTFKFDIPDAYKNMNLVAIRLQSPITGYYSYNWFVNQAAGIPNTGPSLPAGTVPTITIVSVDPGKTVTIQTNNYPANDTFDVLMNKIGTLGIGGTKVDTINTGSGGTLSFTFNIPDTLKNENQIAIRLQSSISGYYSYNWFWNTTAGIPNTGPTLPVGTIPTFSITKVDAGNTVTIQTNNFPANDTFDVLMNTFGTLGVGGTKVASVDTGTGGVQTFTFSIPASLKDLDRIAIRLQSPTSGYFAYNWFWNNTAGIPPTGGTPLGVVPTISITKVVKDTSVTIQTSNYPANDTFDVYMNTFGTLGVGGTKVASVDTGTGGTQTFTFDIPSSLKGLGQIAIRLQSPTSGYYSYNWFWNVTYP